MAENIVGKLQKIGIRRNHADCAVILAGIKGDCFLKFPAVIQACHGIPFGALFQNIFFLPIQRFLILQGADNRL